MKKNTNDFAKFVVFKIDVISSLQKKLLKLFTAAILLLKFCHFATNFFEACDAT